MLRRDTPNGDRTELTEMLRRLSRTGGSVTVKLDGKPIARVDPRPRAATGEPPADDDDDA